jgi:hypothetical protein
MYEWEQDQIAHMKEYAPFQRSLRLTLLNAVSLADTSRALGTVVLSWRSKLKARRKH